MPGGDRRIDGTNHLLSETFASQGDHRDIAVDTFGSPEVIDVALAPAGNVLPKDLLPVPGEVYGIWQDGVSLPERICDDDVF